MFEILLGIVVLIAAQGIYRNWDVYTGKRTTYDALPEHLDEQSEIDAAFPDDSQFANRKGLLGVYGRALKKFNKLTKPWMAVGPRSRFWWARWRETPITLFAIKGKGKWRFENDEIDLALNDRNKVKGWPNWYLSRVQYWCRWHFAVNWPLQITFHVYWKESSVPKWPDHGGDTNITDMLYVYGPGHRDADKVYWLISGFIGGGWK